MLKLKKRSRIDVGSLKPQTMCTLIVKMDGGDNYSISICPYHLQSTWSLSHACYTKCGKELLRLLNAKVQVPTEITHIYIYIYTSAKSRKFGHPVACWKSFHLQPPSFILVGQLLSSSCPPLAETLYILPKHEDMAPWYSKRRDDSTLFPQLVVPEKSIAASLGPDAAAITINYCCCCHCYF